MVEVGLVDPPDGYKPPLWKRNKKGSVVHHYYCPRAANGYAWFWPENIAVQTDAELLVAIASIPWIKPAKCCFPS